MSSRSVFVWNPDIGRRSRVNIKTGKSIRKRDDGVEVFEDYWTESESDEWTSEDGTSDIVKTKHWESTRIEEKEDTVHIQNIKNKDSLQEQSPVESEKENNFSKKNQDKTAEIFHSNNSIGGNLPLSLSKDNKVHTPSLAKRNVTNPLTESDIIQTPISKRSSTKRNISGRKYTGSSSKPCECKSVDGQNFHSRKVLNFDEEESSSDQENATANLNSSERPAANIEVDEVSDDVTQTAPKHFNIVSMNAKSSPKTANITNKSFGLSMPKSLFSDSEDDDENFSFVLTNKNQKASASKTSLNDTANATNVAKAKKVTEKRKHNRSEIAKNYPKKLSQHSLNGTDNEKNSKSSKKSVTKETEILLETSRNNTTFSKTNSNKKSVSTGENNIGMESDRISKEKIAIAVEKAVERIHNNSDEIVFEKLSKDGAYICKPNEFIDDSMFKKTGDKKHTKPLKGQKRNKMFVSQANSVEGEVRRIHNTEVIENISQSGSHSYTRREHSIDKSCKSNTDGGTANLNDSIIAEIGVGLTPIKTRDVKSHSKVAKDQHLTNDIISQFSSSEENDVQNIHNSEDPLQNCSENDKTTSESDAFNNVKKRKQTTKLFKKKPKMNDGEKHKIVGNKDRIFQNKSKNSSNSQKNTSANTDSENSADVDKNVRRLTRSSSSEMEFLLHSKRKVVGKSKKQSSNKKVIHDSSSDQSQDDLYQNQSLQHKIGAESYSVNKEKKRKDDRNTVKLSKQKDNERKRLQLNEKLKKDRSNRKRKMSPVKQNLDDNQNEEVIIAAQSKINIVSLPPVRNPTPGVRRSKRVRVKPLEHWRNQRIHYQRSENGYTVKGIEQGFDDEPKFAKWSQNYEDYVKSNNSKKKLENKNSSEWFNDISVHDMSALASNDIIEERNTPVPIRCLETDNEVLAEVVSVHDSLEWTGMEKSPVSKDDAVAIAVSLLLPNASTGFMKIRPHQEKKLQYLPNNSALYVILYGKLLIQINTSTFILKTGDMFHVPCGNGYSIKNLRKDEAELQFTVFHSLDTIDEEKEEEVEC